MPGYELQMRAEMANLQSVTPVDPNRWHVSIECSSCQTENKSIWVDNNEELQSIPGSRGEAHTIVKCKFCSKSSNLTFVEDAKRTGGYMNEHSGQPLGWQTLAVIECRGCVITKWHMQGEWIPKNENMTFEPTELDEDFADYDDKDDVPVTIEQIETRVK